MRRRIFIGGLLAMIFVFGGMLILRGQDADTISASYRSAAAAVDSIIVLSGHTLSAGSPEDAYKIAEEAYSRASRIDYHGGMGDALMIMGGIEQQKGQMAAALRNYFTAMREYEWLGSAEKQASAALIIGDIFHSARLYDKAREYYQISHDLGRPFLSISGLLALREKIADCYQQTGKLEEALAIYRELQSGYRSAGNSGAEIGALERVTYCLTALGRYDEAESSNREVLEMARQTNNHQREMAALNNLGYNARQQEDPEEALSWFRQAYELGLKMGASHREMTSVLTNMAIIQQNLGQYRDALDNFFKAEKIAAASADIRESARIKHLVAVTYYIMEDYHNAGAYNRESLRLAEQARDAGLMSASYLTASNIAAALYDFEASLREYQDYLAIRDSVLRKEQVFSQDLSQQQYLVEKTEKELDEMMYARQMERMELNKLRLESEKKEQDLELLRKTADLREAELLNRELEKNRALQELLLAEERLAAERKDREIKDLKVQQQLQESELKRGELEQEKQKQEIRVLTQEKEISELNLQKIRSRNLFLAGATLLSLIILVIIIRSWRYARKVNRVLFDQRNKIQQQKEAIESQYDIIKIEREKSEKLLLNILPEETAAELKENGYATPRHYDKVTVLFTDFVGFTQVSEKMTPQEIVRELDYCFLEFDRIIDRHNLEKIKTIGDSYMCAGGIPLANDTNPWDVVHAALEIRDFMDTARKARESKGEAYWQLRIGVHTGPVVAGVVGKNKFAYDIWGDAVNTASRMESSGEAGKVNISGKTYEIVNKHFHCTYRGKVKAKNKGEVDMYFVEGPLETSE